MSIDILQTVDIIEIMENYIETKRPPKNIRHKVDISYKIENQSIIIFEIRPVWNNPTVFQECSIAKTTYVKRQQVWKIFWMRASLKWESFEPKPEVKNTSTIYKNN